MAARRGARPVGRAACGHGAGAVRRDMAAAERHGRADLQEPRGGRWQRGAGLYSGARQGKQKAAQAACDAGAIQADL